MAAVNYDGSTGWGQAFTDSITGEYGKRELDDVEKGTDYLLAQGYIDPARLAAAGGSYGGYMMAWMNGHTTRYKAMVCHAGVYDWVAQMASDVVRGRDRALGGFPWESPQRVLEESAHSYAKNFKTPTLVVHNQQDFRVPVTQGLEYYTTLRMLGVPSRLLYFPDENHFVLKPQNSRLWYNEFFDWIGKYAAAGPAALTLAVPAATTTTRHGAKKSNHGYEPGRENPARGDFRDRQPGRRRVRRALPCPGACSRFRRRLGAQRRGALLPREFHA